MSSKGSRQQECPHCRLLSLDSIVAALGKDKSYSGLLDWFSCTEFSCSNQEQCRVQRVMASFQILNGIRMACKPYLDSGRSDKKPLNSTPKNTIKVVPSRNDEEHFPSLLPISNGNSADKKKKRIRPLQTVAPAAGTLGVWGEIAKQAPQQPKPTIAMGKPIPPQVNSTQVWASKAGSKPIHQGGGQPKSPTQIKPSNLVKNTPPRQQTAEVAAPSDLSDFKKTEKNTHSNGAATGNPTLDRLVQVYCQLLLNGLVPSVALEAHLLLRLLHISDAEYKTFEVAEAAPTLAFIFTDGTRCQCFATKALSELWPLLRHFGVHFLQDLVKSQCFRAHLPDLTEKIESFTHQQISDGYVPLTNDQAFFSGASQTVVLALPFQAPRDSRHNFKTRDQVAMYKNREETRDAFLYQLRSFLNIKGKMVDTVQAQKSVEQIIKSFRVILDGVIGANMPWFAQFFCELLLQVGLTPVEETDKDLFIIAGKEKLQKLHKRFSSMVGGAHSNKSSWKLASDRSNRHFTTSPKEQAKEYFPGHQEFFYLFIISIDSYRLNSHLRNQLVHLIKRNLESVGNHYSTSLEKKLLEMQMLAKFLGVLVFSPSWQEVDGNTNIYTEGAPPDGLQQLESDAGDGLPLRSIIRISETQGNLTKVIPWVAELLKMASWDESLLSRSSTYKTLITLLRQVRARLRTSLYHGSSWKGSTPSFQLVIWCLDVFFGEHLGLTKSESLAPAHGDPSNQLGPGSQTDAATLDESPLMFCTSTLIAVNPPLEELFSLATALSYGDYHRLSPGISRKLRPLVLTSGFQLTTAGDGPADRSYHTKVDADRVTKLLAYGDNALEVRMADVFFHQHPELKEICEFSVHRILRQVTKALPQRMAKLGKSSASASELTDFMEESRNFLRTRLEDGVSQALTLLEPLNTHPRLRQLAVSLAVARGYETGRPLMETLVSNDLKVIQCTLFREETSFNGNVGNAPVETAQQSQLCTLTENINHLRMQIAGGVNTASLQSIGQCLSALRSLVTEWTASPNPKIPPEKLLRCHFESIAKLDRHSSRFIHSCLGHDEDSKAIDPTMRWKLLAEFLVIASQLSLHPRRGLSRVGKILGESELQEEFVRFGVTNDSLDGVTRVLKALVEGDLLSEQHVAEISVGLTQNGKGYFTDVI